MHPCISLDIHANIPPFPPLLPYFWIQILGGLPIVNKRKMCKKTYTWHFPAMQKGTDIGRMIIHIGNPANLKLPFIILGSASKSNFGASKVKVENNTVATACLIMTNINMNCCDPFDLPLGMVIAPNTVQAGMSIGDYIAGVLNSAIDSLLGWGIGKVITGPLSKWATSELGKGMVKVAWEWVIGEAVKMDIGLLRDLSKELGFDTDLDQMGDWAGNRLDSGLEGTGAQDAFDQVLESGLDGDGTRAVNESVTSGFNAVGDFFSDSEIF